MEPWTVHILLLAPPDFREQIGAAAAIVATVSDECRKKISQPTHFNFLIDNDTERLRAHPKRLEKVEIVIGPPLADTRLQVLTEIWDLLPNLKWLHSLTAGMDTWTHVLLENKNVNFLERKFLLTNASGAFSQSLAEWCMAVMFHFNKDIPGVIDFGKRVPGVWNQWDFAELRNKTVCFVGYGNIANHCAVFCKLLRMRIVSLRRSASSKLESCHWTEPDFTYETSKLNEDELLGAFRAADFVVCTLPKTKHTRHFISEKQIFSMKKSAVFISLGRGDNVDEKALVKALKNKEIAGAALDVFEQEPLPADSPLWGMDNVLLTPHCAGQTGSFFEDLWGSFESKLPQYLDGKLFDKTVDLTHGY